MLTQFFDYLDHLSGYLWSYFTIPLVVTMGLFLTIKMKGAQITGFSHAIKTFYSEAKNKKKGRGVHPISAFFASIGGCIGIGNLVAVCTAIHIGGPGAIFWMWIAALIGMIIKYAEVYLGILHRTPNRDGGFDGGPMYYLQKVTRSRFLPILFCLLLAIYGTEVYMFDVMTHTVVENWHINHYVAIAIFLISILYATKGGIHRVGKITTFILPIFMALFCAMTAWILFLHAAKLPTLFIAIVKSAFQGHAPLGGFAGGSMMLALSQGVTRACYSADIGTGNASIIHAESRQSDPKKQACLSILGIFLDTFVVCTTTAILILATGIWSQDVPASMMVQQALAAHFPYMHYFMPLFLIVLGYSSIISFSYVGLKCSIFIHPKWGKRGYYLYACIAFVLFSFVDQSQALTLMSLTGAGLLCINLWGIYQLRKEIIPLPSSRTTEMNIDTFRSSV
ncbi:MAG: amino acid carrier protein [Chlamydiota bacterium]